MKLFIDEKSPDIIAITEVMPKNKEILTINEINIPGYDNFINKNPKRGVILYAKCQLNAVKFSNFSSPLVKGCCENANMSMNMIIMVSIFYRNN